MNEMGVELSPLEILILRSILVANKVEDVAKLVKVQPAKLGMHIAKLQLSGYIADDGSLTQKGKEAIVEPSPGNET
jgi:DNA-binding MarR family transcriptional regulator